MTTVLVAVGMVLAAVGAVLAWVRRRWMIVVVDGTSMAPTLAPGARLVVRRTAATTIRVGDVVVAEAPLPGPQSLIVKRVIAVPGDPVPSATVPALASPGATVPAGRYLLLGDNPADSRDSRVFGYLHAERVRGVVVRAVGSG